ncbi:MAG: hypothetical protein H0V17_33435 [Deltaproteobacteria bacterium]|nr:hypothetical protein [Deltaproteobacteria bacterium]
MLWQRCGATPETLARALAAMSDDIAGLDISGSSGLLGTTGIELLRPYLQRFTYLNLRNVPIQDVGLAALANEPAAAHLDTLLVGGQITSDGLLALARSPHLRLRRLQILDAVASHDVWATLLGSPVVAGLTTLLLARADIDESGIRTMGENVRALESLVLDGSKLHRWGPLALATSPVMPQLVRLGLPRNRLDTDDITTLVDAHFPSLHTIDLSENCITEPAVLAIRDRRGMPTLARIVLERETTIPTGSSVDYYDQGALVSSGMTYHRPCSLKQRYFPNEPVDLVDQNDLSWPDSSAEWL